MIVKYGSITLKWGTLKGWDIVTPRGLELLQKYYDLGTTFSAAMQRDTPEQKQILCELIDECNDPRGIFLDWDEVYVSKETAKRYVMETGTGEYV